MAHSCAPSSKSLTLGFAAALVVAAAPAASAQIQPMQLPGVDSTTQVFPIDSDDISVAVASRDADNGSVDVTVTNNTEEALQCSGLDDAAAGTVAPAALVAKAVDFYANYPHSDLSAIEISFSGMVGSFDDIEFDLGSAVDLFPGSIAGMINAEWGALADLGSDFSQARLDGHIGETENSFDIPAEDSTEMNVALGQTSGGDRQDFDAGFYMTCELDDQRYVFHGFENGETPNTGSSQGSLTGSLGTDSLGS